MITTIEATREKGSVSMPDTSQEVQEITFEVGACSPTPQIENHRIMHVAVDGVVTIRDEVVHTDPAFRKQLIATMYGPKSGKDFPLGPQFEPVLGDECDGHGGALHFHLPDGSSALCFDAHGAIWVDGEKVDSHAAFEAFSNWVEQCDYASAVAEELN